MKIAFSLALQHCSEMADFFSVIGTRAELRFGLFSRAALSCGSFPVLRIALIHALFKLGIGNWEKIASCGFDVVRTKRKSSV